MGDTPNLVATEAIYPSRGSPGSPKPNHCSNEKDARGMTIADITLAAFTLCNSLRVVAYFPQIARAARDTSGAEAISFGTWGLFLVSHTSATAYAVVNQ